MINGFVDKVTVNDHYDWQDMQAVPVTVDFVIDRSVLFEFMDALRPIERNARREPIEAILDYSAKLGIEVNE